LSKAKRRAAAPALSSVGIDIVEIKRIRTLAKKNSKFLKRVFSDAEIKYCNSKKQKWQHFAVRFAAKEAVWKALGKVRQPITEISITHDKSGRPQAVVRGRVQSRVQISLTHSDDYAAAVAICT
jgi:holo-[acyl-carrier protein] synthase